MKKASASCGACPLFASVFQILKLAAVALAIIVVLVAAPQLASAQGKTIVVFAPHPDDEGLCCAGIISAAKAAGNTVKIVVVTNGDFYGYNTTAQREAETVNGMALLGVSESDIIFLGYGDQLMLTLFQSPSPTTVYTSAAGQTQTYATRGLGGVDYHTYLHGSPGPYNQQTALADIESALQNLHPDEIYTTSLWDDHPDHQATFTFVTQAILALRKQGVTLSLRVHETLIHAPCSSCGVPVNDAYLWPGGGANVLPRFNPGVIYSEPYYLGSNTTYEWNRIENVQVPVSMQSLSQTANLKAQIVAAYPSQGGGDPANYLYSFVKQNEFFWIHDYVTNLAGLATVTESSQTTDSGQLGTSAIDGFVEGDPDGYEPFEWAALGELNGAWIRLTWPTSVTISSIALFDRPNLIDNVISGTLSFSDGSSVPVGTLPNNGNSYLVTFPRKTVTWVQFTVNNAVGDNIGLAEIEVYGVQNGTTVNHPQIFSGPTPNLTLQNDAYGQPYAASLADNQSVNFTVSALDVNGQALSYNWVGNGGTFTGAGSSVTFHPPVVSASTLVTATVTVSDPQGATAQNTAYVTVTPSNSSGLSVSSLVLNPSSVASGSTATATLTLSGNASNGAIVALTSSNPSVAALPATVTVPAGSNTATFPITTVYVVSTQSVNITAALGGSPQTSVLTVLQPSVTIGSLTPAAPTVGGGNPDTVTVTLSGAAPTGGAVIALSSNLTTVASVPATVTVPGGATSANFTATTYALTSATSVTLTASYVGQSVTTSLRVAPYVAPNLATYAAVTVSSETPAYGQLGIKAVDGIVDGSPAPGDYTKEWATNGQLAGAWIRLTWAGGATVSQAILYDRPNLTDNVTSGTLTFSDGSSVPVGTLPNNGSALTVTFPNRTVTWMQFTVNSANGVNIGLAEIAAIGTLSPASLSTITLNPSTLVGGGSSTGTVTLTAPASGTGAVVTLTSTNTAVAPVPSSVTVPSGATSATFNITTSGVSSSTPVTISGTYGLTQSATLTVNPLSLASVTLSPSSVTGGTPANGTVTLAGAASGGGAVVTLSSNNSAGVVPATVTVPPGSTSANFTMATNSVVTATSVTVTATYNGSMTASIWVTPTVNGSGMTQFATDNFVRANGPLGTNWSTVFDGDSSPVIVGNTVQSNWGRVEGLYYGGINWPADQYAQAQITGIGGGSVGPAVRMTSNGSFYTGTVGSFGTGSANVYILLDQSGGRSLVASSSSATVLPNDYIQLSVQGTTLTLTNVTQSTTLLTATDSTIQAGYPGFYVGGTGGTAITNWSAGVSSSPLTLNSLATDNFNRADSPNLGSNWTVGPGYYAIQILNDLIESAGQGQPPGQGHGKEYYTGVTFPSDQWSQAQVMSSNGDINGSMVRYQGTSDTHYVGLVVHTGGPGTCSVNIDRDINASPVILVSDGTYCSVSQGDYLRLQVQGSLLSYIDVTTGSLLLTVTDSQLTGGSPGWSLNPIGGTPTAANWSGGGFGQ